MREVRVALGERGYTIKVGRGLLDRLGPECARLGLGRRCALVTDARVAARFGPQARRSLVAAGFDTATVTLPAGERSKNLRRVAACYARFAAHRLERGSFVVALGGGVVGDLAGFAAATYLRGIGFVQVSTTLLAQVDSSVGGKVGVNLPEGKNLVGAFHQPRLVLCDLDTLATLPRRELRAGLAEVIKYGIVYDASLFRRLERDLEDLLRLESGPLAAVVARCCQIKAEIVREDETERGLRSILNFGHTVGHALEAVSRYGRYLHGEAIAIGQVAAAALSTRLAGLPEDDARRIGRLFERAGLPVAVRLSQPQRARLLAAMRLDKKVEGGDVRFVLARRLGEVVHGRPVPTRLLSEILR